jgi:hypothetical protein
MQLLKTKPHRAGGRLAALEKSEHLPAVRANSIAGKYFSVFIPDANITR